MNPELIRLLGLISLRALAEFDPAEYRRATDMSKPYLDREIEARLEYTEDREARELYETLRLTSERSDTPQETAFLQRHVYSASFSRAQYFAFRQNRENERLEHRRMTVRPVPDERRNVGERSNEELIRLSTMSLLRTLRNYSFQLHRRSGNIEHDAVLEPTNSEWPQIFVEVVESDRTARRKSRQLHTALRSGQGRGVGLLIADPSTAWREGGQIGDHEYLMHFDVRKNQFVEDVDAFVSFVQSGPSRE
jgi:hypothetical protein